MTSDSGVTLTKTPNWADVSVSGNVPTDDVTRMSVDASGAAHIMSLLTDLYSDPELAVLREYTSNGIDSHRAAGQTAPIEVHLPSALSPNFIVQDHGTGMSKDDIKKIYSSYGASTKRNDLNQIGAFGLGCKSALTLTQQFTLVSIKDKKRTIAHILRGADGVGEVSILKHEDHDAPNGVRVTIPVPDHSTFVSKAEKFFYTWNSADVLVNNEKPKTLFDLDHITFKPTNGNAETAHLIRPAAVRGWYDKFEHGLYLMLSGIRYDVDVNNSAVYDILSSELLTLVKQTSLIIEVPIGSVDLVPSREALRYSPRTVKNLEHFLDKIMQDVYALVLADVVDAPTRRDAISRRAFWSDVTRDIAKLDFKWGTEDIPKAITLKEVYVNTFSYSSRSNAGYVHRLGTFTGDGERGVNIAGLAESTRTYYVVDKRTPSDIRGYSTMFRDYLRHNDIDLSKSTLFHLMDEPTDPWFLDLTQKVSIDTMLADAKAYRAAERAADPKATYQRTDVTYDMINVAADGTVSFVYDVPSAQIDPGTYVLDRSSEAPYYDEGLEFYIKKRGAVDTRIQRERNAHVKSVLAATLPGGGSLVIVDRARKVSALKARTNNVVGTDFYAMYVATAKRLLTDAATDDAAVALVLSGYGYDRVSPTVFATTGLNDMVNVIDDPEIVDLLKTLNKKGEFTKEYVHYLRIVARVQVASDDTETKSKALRARVDTILDHYPLLGALAGRTSKRSVMLNDMVEYLNTKYGKANEA